MSVAAALEGVTFLVLPRELERENGSCTLTDCEYGKCFNTDKAIIRRENDRLKKGLVSNDTAFF